MGHLTSFKHQYSTCLEKYVAAFSADPSQPLTALCLSATLTFLSLHPHVKRKGDACGKALSLFALYSHLRVPETKVSSNKAEENSVERYRRLCCQQEVFYNLACLYGKINMQHLAEHFFLRAIEMDDLDESPLRLTQEAAFNLSLIYRESGNDNLAYDVLKKHLSM
jgi:general transcription factor 3C polypeptide 3 (transcription factor C subunit 4)